MSKFLQQIEKRIGKKRMSLISKVTDDGEVMIVDLKDGYCNPYAGEISWVYGHDWEDPLYEIFDDLKYWLDLVRYDEEIWKWHTT